MKPAKIEIDPTVKITTRPDGSMRIQQVNLEPSLTDPQFKEQCDVNNILKYHTRSRTPLPMLQGKYMDLTNAPDYMTALITIHNAEEAFMDLPAEARYRFQNDPSQLIHFLKDPKNSDEAIRLGLINKPPPTPQAPNQLQDKSAQQQKSKKQVPATSEEE